jgi:hypothetical protein
MLQRSAAYITLSLMNLRALGIETSSSRNTGRRVQYFCSLTGLQLRALLPELPIGGEVLVPDLGENECYRECRRTNDGFEVKRGCHGAHGTWRPATLQEAEAWLGPGLAVAERTCRAGYGVTLELPA